MPPFFMQQKQQKQHVVSTQNSPRFWRGLVSVLLFSDFLYSSQPRALAPRTAALAFMRPDTRNLALPWKILSTALL